MTESPDFTGVTELAGDPASKEQVLRGYRRYYWAGQYVAGRDVLEVGCGAGQGLGYLARTARRVVGGDISGAVLANARRHYGNRIELHEFDAERLPFADASFDVVLMFEAIYYVRDVRRFIAEARRVLRPEGYLLIVTANKDLFDFSPSPFGVAYYGVCELGDLLREAGFRVAFSGDTPVDSVSPWQRLLRPAKFLATKSRVMPKSKRMKAVLKRVVFGPIVALPAEIEPGVAAGGFPTPIADDQPDRRYKVIHAEARRI